MNELTIKYPAGDEAVMLAEVKKIYAAKDEAIDRIHASATNITADNYRAEKLNAFDAEEKRFKAASEAVAAAAAKATKTDAILFQLAAARNAVKAEIEARQKIIRDLKAQFDPPAPVHTYVFQADVTDADFKKVVALLAKTGAAYRYVVMDNRDGKADKFFAANGWKEA